MFPHNSHYTAYEVSLQDSGPLTWAPPSQPTERTAALPPGHAPGFQADFRGSVRSSEMYSRLRSRAPLTLRPLRRSLLNGLPLFLPDMLRDSRQTFAVRCEAPRCIHGSDPARLSPSGLSRFGAKLRDVFTAPIPRASHPPAALCADPVDRYWFSSLLIPVWFSAVTGYKPHYREGGRVCQDIKVLSSYISGRPFPPHPENHPEAPSTSLPVPPAVPISPWPSPSWGRSPCSYSVYPGRTSWAFLPGRTAGRSCIPR